MATLLLPRPWPRRPDTSLLGAYGVLADLCPSLPTLPIPTSNHPFMPPQPTAQQPVYHHTSLLHVTSQGVTSSPLTFQFSMFARLTLISEHHHSSPTQKLPLNSCHPGPALAERGIAVLGSSLSLPPPSQAGPHTLRLLLGHPIFHNNC